MVTAREAGVADRLRVLRVHGSRSKYHYELLGTNSRLDTLQAAILRVKLRYLDNWTKARQERAAIYRQLFEDKKLTDFVTLPEAPSYSNTCFGSSGIRKYTLSYCPRWDWCRRYSQLIRANPFSVIWPW